MITFACGVTADDRLSPPRREQVARWWVTHGAIAAVLSTYVIFHLGNHLTGLLGPAVHAHVMAAGRIVYRSGAAEPVLVALLVGQFVIGARLAWRWCQSTMYLHRSLPVASGAYVGDSRRCRLTLHRSHHYRGALGKTTLVRPCCAMPDGSGPLPGRRRVFTAT